MQQDNTLQDKGPGKETSKPRMTMKQDKKTRDKEKTSSSPKSTHSKSCGFHPKSRKAVSLQTADGLIFYISTYAFYTSGHFDTCVKMKITRVEMTTKKEQAVQMSIHKT